MIQFPYMAKVIKKYLKVEKIHNSTWWLINEAGSYSTAHSVKKPCRHEVNNCYEQTTLARLSPHQPPLADGTFRL